MKEESIEAMRMIYGRLLGLQGSLGEYSVPSGSVTSYTIVLQKISDLLDEDERSEIEDLQIKHHELREGSNSMETYQFKPKLYQLIAWMEQKFGFAEKVISLGSLINEIKDQTLKTRSIEIMARTRHYDIPVGQATLVLEDRIRKKANHKGKESGVELCNTLIKPDPKKTVIKISDDHAIQEGFANICRGIMQSYRNPTHHHLVEMDKIDAMKICAFIDLILKTIDSATVRS